jgi:hypothetical protein
MLEHVFVGSTRVRVTGDVEYLINRNSRGWVVTLINNNGVYKPQQGMAQVDRTAKVTATISELGGFLSAQEWITEKKLNIERNSVSIELNPGGIAIVELVLK